jgi:gamma-glutamyltranspeptidase/glutathione hydrolase
MADVPFSWAQPYPSRRAPVLARNVVATSQPLAVQAGVRALERGGNAVDAALAAAIALVVVEPTNNGVGADAFAIVWDGERLHGLNGSGRAPAAFDPKRLAADGGMPMLGWDSVTVPGAVDVWATLSRRFGRLRFRELFESAIAYAREGFLVSPIVAAQWEMVAPMYASRPEFGAAFLPGGRAPRAGERFALRDLAATLEEIAATEGESFYRGPIADRIAAHARATGGALAASDLNAHRSEWVAPLARDYHGVTLNELPPNTQGICALIALAILSHFDLSAFPADSADSLHLQIEAMKLAIADTRRSVGDPELADVPVAHLLDDERIAARARLIERSRARPLEEGRAGTGDTVYLTAADADGMMVSYIQSNYFAFGSGIVVPGTGISLQNRGACFTLETGHPNAAAPGKRPFHTIIPAFVTRGAEPLMSFGVMGGPMQPQGHAQVLVRVVDYGQNPQAAIDAPRWHVLDGLEVAVEDGFSGAVLDDLAARGHELQEAGAALFGGAQAIWRLDDGWLGASDPRKDGLAAGF